MKTAIMTDTNSGIMSEEAEKLGIFSIPMPIIIDEKTYFEGVDITDDEFYDALTSGKNCSTSQPTPGDVTDMWDKILSMGYDQIVHMPMSSGLSNSCATAEQLAEEEEYEGKVFIADNHRISITLKEEVLKAKRMADEGASGEEIQAFMIDDAYNATIYVTVSTLEYLKKGGRITPAAALLGEALDIKPILTIQGGKLDSFAKVRGMKKCQARMMDTLVDEMKNRFPDADPAKTVVGMAGTALSEETITQWTDQLRQLFPGTDIYYNPLSLSIGCHTGPGAIGIGFTFR